MGEPLGWKALLDSRLCLSGRGSTGPLRSMHLSCSLEERAGQGRLCLQDEDRGSEAACENICRFCCSASANTLPPDHLLGQTKFLGEAPDQGRRPLVTVRPTQAASQAETAGAGRSSLREGQRGGTSLKYKQPCLTLRSLLTWLLSFFPGARCLALSLMGINNGSRG